MATASFFATFQGSLTIESRYGWSGLTGWFRSYLDAFHLGLSPEQQNLSVDVEECSLSDLSQHLARALKSRGSTLRIRRLCIFFRCNGRDLEKSFALLSGLQQLATSIDLRLEITPRPPVALQTITPLFASLPRCISLVEVAIRLRGREGVRGGETGSAGMEKQRQNQ